MDIIYIGPTCPRCINNEYTIQLVGPNEIPWKRCTECGRFSQVGDDDLVEKPSNSE